MIRLPPPRFSYEDTLDKCQDGIQRKPALLRRLSASREELLEAAHDYQERLENGTLYRIAPLGKVGDAAMVIGELTKPDMVKVYEKYLVADKKPGRKIYEALLLANAECPFCAVGQPRNLDHFLPKGQFPQFSVFPHNLVPCCRDCNMDGKGEDFAVELETQIIHPYSDRDLFFRTQWLSAAYHVGPAGGRGRVEFFANPPEEWQNSDKAKVREHFHRFSLGKRYGTLAATRLAGVIRQMERSKVGASYELACERILAPIIDDTALPNDWFRVMHQALMQHYSQLN